MPEIIGKVEGTITSIGQFVHTVYDVAPEEGAPLQSLLREHDGQTVRITIEPLKRFEVEGEAHYEGLVVDDEGVRWSVDAIMHYFNQRRVRVLIEELPRRKPR